MNNFTRFGVLLTAIALSPAAAQQPTASTPATGGKVAPDTQDSAEDRRKLTDFTRAWQRHEAEAGAYWTVVTEKRRARSAKRRSGQAIGLDDYVLTQPPLHAGPPRPPGSPASERPAHDRKYVPTIPEILASAQQYFQFVPERPANELAFKRAYARAVVAEKVAPDIAVRIYAFETGGIGTYDVQSGLLNARPGAKPLSAAIGYNQLLITYTIHLLSDQGEDFVRMLSEKASTLPPAPRAKLAAKIATLQRMIAFSRTVHADWNSQEKLGETRQGWGLHAVLLDEDIGPLLQARKLTGSIRYARAHGHRDPLTAAELQMMNLMGDGSGLDILLMPQSLREQVPTANFFQRRGYERNAVASRHNTVARLLAATDARMESAVVQQGARELAGAF